MESSIERIAHCVPYCRTSEPSGPEINAIKAPSNNDQDIAQLPFDDASDKREKDLARNVLEDEQDGREYSGLKTIRPDETVGLH